MSANEQNTITAPGVTITIGDPSLDRQAGAQNTVTALAPFESIKNSLSSNALRRPNRTRPIEESK